jgi:alkanesulfonate monooxygenase SsuD/methylene tetrahydromethanopterin reductase-like flavin-dependent oxidoreductase (luciferase family)
VSRRGFVLPGTLPDWAVAELALEIEQCGYDCVWITVVDGEYSPATLAHAAISSTKTLHVGLGVIPIDRYSASDVAQQIQGCELPADRVTVGFGVGRGYRHAPDRMRKELTAFAASAPQFATAVGTYSAGVLAVAGEMADSLVLNWMTPDRVAWALDQATSSSNRLARSITQAYVYVPVSIGPDARSRIAASLQSFRSSPHHRRNLAAIGSDESLGLAIDSTTGASVRLLEFEKLGPVVPVLNPVGDLTVAERSDLVRRFRPAA